MCFNSENCYNLKLVLVGPQGVHGLEVGRLVPGDREVQGLGDPPQGYQNAVVSGNRCGIKGESLPVQGHIVAVVEGIIAIFRIKAHIRRS